MFARTHLAPSLATLLMLASAVPAMAEGPIIITQAKALAGNITPADTPGFPVTINKAGTYQLGSNLTASAGKNGIEVTAGHVTLDFNGFTLTGGGQALIGVLGDKPDFRIRDGSVINFKQEGIYGSGDFWNVIGMTVTGNGYQGVRVVDGGEYLRVLNSTIAENANTGVTCNVSCQIEGSIISRNGFRGALVYSGTVLGNTFVWNNGDGLHAASVVGYGNNTFVHNNNQGPQVSGSYLRGLHPNVCAPACP